MIARLTELEKQEEELELEIAAMELKKPRLTEKTIKAWLNSFRIGDVEDPAFQERLLDTFVARVEVKNGEARVFFNVSGEGSVTITKVNQTNPYPNTAGCSVTNTEVELPSWKPNTSIEVIPGYILLYIQL